MPRPYESFEEAWGGGNHTSLDAFSNTDLFVAPFDNEAGVETFTYAWKAPATDGTLEVGTGEGAAFTGGQKVYDQTSKGTGFVSNVSGDTVSFVGVQSVGNNFGAINSTLSACSEGFTPLGVGDGFQCQFGDTLTGPVAPGTLHVHVVMSNMTYDVIDNTLGSLIDPANIINENLTASIDYATGIVDFSVTQAIAATLIRVEAFYIYGADLGTVAVAFVRQPVQPYNHSAKEEFSLGDVVGTQDDFETGWDNDASLASLAEGVTTSPGPDTFETGWQSNQNAKDGFPPAGSGVLDTVVLETFESGTGWTTPLVY